MIDERFARTELIFGEAGMQRLQSARVAVFGVGAMFLMIGAGVYEVVVASGEKKPLKDLLKSND